MQSKPVLRHAYTILHAILEGHNKSQFRVLEPSHCLVPDQQEYMHVATSAAWAFMLMTKVM